MSKKAIIRLLDETTCSINNLRSEHYMFFHDAYAIFAPNYFFNPKFKLGVWDGKLRYFHETGKTYINLLDEIIPTIIKLGYEVAIEDDRKSTHLDVAPINEDYFGHVVDSLTNEPIKLRYYQVEAVNKCINHGSGIVIAGTGSGKTKINAALVDVYGKKGLKTITIVPSQDLILQTKEEFEQDGLDVGEYSGASKTLNHTHVVSTWQALQNNPRVLQEFQVVVLDECHGVKGNVLKTLLIEGGKHIQYRFGLTGTLPKEKADAMAVRIAIGDVRYTIKSHELIEQKYLADLEIEVIEIKEDFTKEYNEFKQEHPEEKLTYIQFKNAYLPDYQSEKSYLQKVPKRLELIADMLMTKAAQHKGNIFCLVNGVNVGKKLAALIPGAHFVYGKDDRKTRKSIYDLFKDNDNVIGIATVNVASTGINIPRIFTLAYVDIGKSFIRTIQTIGRGLRKAHDKDKVHVLDICSDLKYSKKHQNERRKYYEEAKYPHKKVTISINDIVNEHKFIE